MKSLLVEVISSHFLPASTASGYDAAAKTQVQGLLTISRKLK